MPATIKPTRTKLSNMFSGGTMESAIVTNYVGDVVLWTRGGLKCFLNCISIYWQMYHDFVVIPCNLLICCHYLLAQ
jgi:hypothetical protein